MARQFTAREFEGKAITRANILLVGPIKAGKSSFLNSVASVCKGRIAKLVKTGSGVHRLNLSVSFYFSKTMLLLIAIIGDFAALTTFANGMSLRYDYRFQ